MSDQQHSDSGSRSGLSLLGIGCGVMLLLLVVLVGVGYMLKDRVRDYFADQAYEDVRASLEQADLDPEEKRDVLQELERLRAGIHANEVSFAELGELVEASMESPMMTLFLTRQGSRWARENADFSAEESEQADLLLDRYLRGRLEGAFTYEDDLELTEIIGEEGPDGDVTIDKKVPTTEELRALIELTRTKVEAAAIPEDEYFPDISIIARELVDSVLR